MDYLVYVELLCSFFICGFRQADVARQKPQHAKRDVLWLNVSESLFYEMGIFSLPVVTMNSWIDANTNSVAMLLTALSRL